MISFEALAIWGSIILMVISVFVFGGGALYAYQVGKRRQQEAKHD